MDDKTFAFAVETTAQIEVLNHAVAYLMARSLLPMSEAGRVTILGTFAREIGEMAPLANPASPEATRFFEAVAVAVADKAEQFAQVVRGVLAEQSGNPGV